MFLKYEYLEQSVMLNDGDKVIFNSYKGDITNDQLNYAFTDLCRLLKKHQQNEADNANRRV